MKYDFDNPESIDYADIDNWKDYNKQWDKWYNEQMKHSPPPWTTATDRHGKVINIKAGEQKIVQALVTTKTKSRKRQANIEFIVKAVNEYDSLKAKADMHSELLDVLKEVTKDLRKLQEERGYDYDSVGDADDLLKTIERMNK